MMRKYLFVLAAGFLLLPQLSGCIAKSPPDADFSDLNDTGNQDTGGDSADAAGSDAAGNDAGADASSSDVGACEPTCEGDTPICDEETGACVECVTDSDCPEYLEFHLTGVCDPNNQCQASADECIEGFVDLDPTVPGCECEITDANDLPDLDGNDTNCDGFDGIIQGANANVVFVDPDGGDDSAGGKVPSAAVKTLATAMEQTTSERRYILAAGGVFEKQVTLKDGVSIFGGYDAADGWKRKVGEVSTVINPRNDVDAFNVGTFDYISVIAKDLDNTTTLDHLTIWGVPPVKYGASSYALWAHNSNGLRVQNVEIIAEKGSTGQAGAAGDKGSARSCNAVGGAGGGPTIEDCRALPPYGAAESGENGSAGVFDTGVNSPVHGGNGGSGGTNSCVATVGLCAAESGDDGDDGHDGGASAPGVPGAPQGSVNASGLWEGDRGTPAAAGENGTGGGGGGGGGTCVYGSPLQPTSAVGEVGGTGGDGGCGGGPGGNGQPGGASVGIFASQSDLVLVGGSITQAAGGNGGRGGSGGQPGKGKNGSVPPNTNDVDGAGEGGDGGNGGDGMAGGAGAGGCGGPSFGIVKYASDFVVPPETEFLNLPANSMGGDDETSNLRCNGLVEEIYDFGG